MVIKPSKLGDSGLLLIEILLAVALMGIITLIILSAFIYGRESTAIAGDRSRAVEIANASLEAVHNIAQDSYGNLASYSDGTPYYLDISGSQWTLVTSPTTIHNIYTPEVVFGSGPATSRQVTISVSWPETSDRTGTVIIKTYLTDWQALTYLPAGTIHNSGEAAHA